MKKINLNGLKKVMSPKEMKNVLGGSSIMPDNYCHSPNLSSCSNGFCVTPGATCTSTGFGPTCYCEVAK